MLGEREKKRDNDEEEASPKQGTLGSLRNAVRPQENAATPGCYWVQELLNEPEVKDTDIG